MRGLFIDDVRGPVLQHDVDETHISTYDTKNHEEYPEEKHQETQGGGPPRHRVPQYILRQDVTQFHESERAGDQSQRNTNPERLRRKCHDATTRKNISLCWKANT